MAAPHKYAVFGHPVAHSRSPWLHARFAELTGQLLSYEARDVPPGEFDAALAEFLDEGGKGLNITLPHKLAAFAAAGILTPRAQRAGAVNTLALQRAGLLGDNTDGAGLLRDLQENLGITIGARRVLLLGAGGAARGALPALLDAAPQALLIANRHAGRAAALAAEFAADGPVSGVALDAPHAPFDVIINATSASLAGEVPALSAAAVGPATYCYDMAYGTQPTAFMRWATAHGAAGASDGIGMLVEQAAESFELWRGLRPPTTSVLEELRRQIIGGTAS
ncbi:MAG: shikimate dehydrogenase [Gammaproteobacteria bacterium]